MRDAMQRIAVILFLFVMLTNAPHKRDNPPLPLTDVTVRVTALQQPDVQVLQGYGPLRLTGLWQMEGSIYAFGGLSAMRVDPHGGLFFLNDSGERARVSLQGGIGYMESLPRPPLEAGEEGWKQDSESLAFDEGSGRFWAGFERVQRICRYLNEKVERCVSPPAVRAWPGEGSLETLVRFSDGRFLAIGERANSWTGGFDVLLWAGDPVEPSTPPPVHLTYRGPPGFRPTDAVWLGGDRLLVLGRRVTLTDGYTARLALVRMPKLVADAELHGEAIARFERPGPSDNMEAMALGFDSQGRPELYVASDDNHFFLQRTLLFRFALPVDWVSDQPAP